MILTSISELTAKIKKYNSDADEALIRKVYIFAKNSHGSQKRHSGEHYFSHPLAVAQILIDLKADLPMVLTALLHDVVEDTDVTLEEIKENFGEEIANLVDGITKLSALESVNVSEKVLKNFRKLVVAISQDIRVLILKLADRLHNMRTLSYMPLKEKRLKIAKETLEIYAPLAARIGLEKVKNELQDLAFSEIDSESKNHILEKIAEITSNQQDLITKIIDDLSEKLKAKKIKFEISGRQKSPYSIWMKLQKRNIGVYNLYDIIAFRVIVKNIEECYKTLGVINTNYNMIPNSFKDYISTPKENGYRSLHLSILGPYNKKIEIQIRDQDMHEIAEFGIAAHCHYKEESYDQILGKSQIGKKDSWANELVNILERSADLSEALEDYKTNVYKDQVFCFTPNGDIFNLPNGATAIDFAYAVHSEVGNKCKAAKINGVVFPLRYKLENGDQVEIVTSEDSKPSTTWLQFVTTSRARTAIKQFIRSQKVKEYGILGEAILKKFFAERELEFNSEIAQKTLQNFNKKTVFDLYVAVAEGLISRFEVLKLTYPEYKEKKQGERKIKEESIIIEGLNNNMAIACANCCNPIPQDRIIGVIDVGSGIKIHRQNCEKIREQNIAAENIVSVSWNKDQPETKLYNSRIILIVKNKSGSLARISSIIAKKNVNINNIEIIDRQQNHFKLAIDAQVQNVEHLDEILATLRKSKRIIEVTRDI